MAEYLHELAPGRGLFPEDQAARAHCRSVSGEVHSGFANLRSALPMNIKARHPDFPLWTGAQRRRRPDRGHLGTSACAARDGPFLFGSAPTVADAMFAPVCTRMRTYDVKLGAVASSYTETMLSLPELVEWTAEAEREQDDVEELEMEF